MRDIRTIILLLITNRKMFTPLLIKRFSERDCFCDCAGDSKPGSRPAEFIVGESLFEITVFSCALPLCGGVPADDVC